MVAIVAAVVLGGLREPDLGDSATTGRATTPLFSRRRDARGGGGRA